MRQLLKKEWKGTQSEEWDFNELKKFLTDKPCLARFARDRDKVATTNASRTGLGIALWQRQNDNTTQLLAFASRYSKDAEKNFSVGDLEMLAVVWRLEVFRFYLYGKIVYL